MPEHHRGRGAFMRRTYSLLGVLAFGLVASGCTLHAWGWNQATQLGDGTATDKGSPVQIGSADAGHGHHTIGLRDQ
jgi:hypothetical protein